MRLGGLGCFATLGSAPNPALGSGKSNLTLWFMILLLFVTQITRLLFISVTEFYFCFWSENFEGRELRRSPDMEMTTLTLVLGPPRLGFGLLGGVWAPPCFVYFVVFRRNW